MSPLSAPVLTAATVVSSPALWSALVTGTLPLDVALTRYLIAVLICWAVLSVIAEFAFPAPGSVRPATPDVEPVEAANSLGAE